jgi:hypothetical protein
MKNLPFRIVLRKPSYCSSVTSENGIGLKIPALFMRTSKPPNSFSARSTRAAPVAGLPISPTENADRAGVFRDLFGGGMKFFLISSAKNDRCAVGDKTLSRLFPDPRAVASNDCYFSLEMHEILLLL